VEKKISYEFVIFIERKSSEREGGKWPYRKKWSKKAKKIK
jgi:hypothetical protein